MAVTIGVGSSASAPGKGPGGFPAGFEAVFARLGGVSADGGTAQGSESSVLAENPFVTKLAAALQALHPGSQADLQAAAMLLAQNGQQNLQNGGVLNGSDLPFGQELPLDPSFPSAVLATFAAINEIIRQQALLAGQALENQSDSLTQAELDAQALALAQMQAQDQAKMLAQTVSAEQALAAGQAGAAAAASVVSGQVVAAANAINAADSSAGSSGLSVGSAGALGETDLQAGPQSQQQAHAANAMAKLAASDAAESADLQRAIAAAQAKQSAQDQSAKDTGIQAVVNRLQAELAQPSDAKESNTGKSLSGLANQASGVDTKSETILSNAVAAASAEFESADAGLDAQALSRSLDLAANNAATARHASNAAMIEQSDNVLGVDAPKALNSRADNIAAQSSVAGASMESRIEAARASLASGPLNVEVLRLTRQGGGRAVLEVTPPNQGPIRLDLQLDGSGRANLVVEGLSEALRARLEGTAHFLRQDMAQMGLALNLEMRERSDGQAQQAAFGQGGSQSQRETERQFRENSLTSTTGPGSGTRATAVRGGDQEDGVHLYA